MSITGPTNSRSAVPAPDTGLFWEATLAVVRVLACLPFDAMRSACATAAQYRLTPRSILASRDAEKLIHALEGAMLGPVARNR